jgi:hypothetical protein
MRTYNHLIILVLFLVGACGDQASTPVPQPVPAPMVSYIRKSSPGPMTTTALIVGLPQAVAGQGLVHFRNQRTGAIQTTRSTPAGSFAVLLEATIDDLLEAQYENADGLSEVVSLGTRFKGLLPELLLNPSDGPGPLSAPDSEGLVTVRNRPEPGSPLYFTATPDSDALVVNVDSNAMLSVRVNGQGELEAKIAAKQNETIEIMLVDPMAPGLTSDHLSFKVP